MVKQVIVVRKDLNMRKGKIAAQASHASLKVFFDRMKSFFFKIYWIRMTKEMKKWKSGAFTKICVSVDSEEALYDIKAKAIQAKIPCALIVDSGKTEFNGVPTATCIALGPDESEKIDRITGNLKLL